ncbi:MAG TPA: DUF2231 domain-containing protein [Acidimicrobiales bacterium]
MELDTLFGLPAHPLIVHAAVVLVPLAAIGTIAIAVSAKARLHIGWIVVALTASAFVLALLGQGSGESLQEKTDESELTEEHAELGETMPWFALPIFITASGVMVLDRRRASTDAESQPSWMGPAVIAMSTAAILASVVGTVRIAQVGHSGARATWQEIQDHPEGESGGGPDTDNDED